MSYETCLVCDVTWRTGTSPGCECQRTPRPGLLVARVEHVRDELRREHTRALDLVGDVLVGLLVARVEHVRDELRREHTRALDLVGDVPVVVRLGVLVQELEDIARTMREER